MNINEFRSLEELFQPKIASWMTQTGTFSPVAITKIPKSPYSNEDSSKSSCLRRFLRKYRSKLLQEFLLDFYRIFFGDSSKSFFWDFSPAFSLGFIQEIFLGFLEPTGRIPLLTSSVFPPGVLFVCLADNSGIPTS